MGSLTADFSYQDGTPPQTNPAPGTSMHPFFIKTFKSGLTLMALCLPPHTAMGASFEGLLTPWQTQGIDADQQRLARSALASSWSKLNSNLFTNTQDLSTASGLTLPINQKKRALQYSTGTLAAGSAFKNRPSRFPLLLEPRWCRIYDFQVIFLTLSDGKTHELLASTHSATPATEWSRMAQSRTLDSYLSGQMTALLSDLTTKPWTPDSASSALNVGFTAKQENTRQSEGQTHCLVQLLEESLAPELSVPRSLGGDHMALLRNIMPDSRDLKRPTRYLLLNIFPTTGKNRERLPLSLKVEMELGEGVFGKQTKVASAATFDLPAPTSSPSSPDLRQWKFDPTTPPLDVLKTVTAQESRALLFAERPTVLKIRGAWAYLDRGRAWGILIGDRLQTADGTIKGHVVRYFGPEENLTAKAGFPVHEGAILFVRKGQTKVKEGMQLDFDGTSFPSPWPPNKQNGENGSAK